jgi:hypothetical protein
MATVREAGTEIMTRLQDQLLKFEGFSLKQANFLFFFFSSSSHAKNFKTSGEWTLSTYSIL